MHLNWIRILALTLLLIPFAGPQASQAWFASGFQQAQQEQARER